MDVVSGQLLGQGRFEVMARIGEGGAGVVYEVKDRQSDARLALKTVRTTGPDALVSLKREFRAVQDMAHPNLVRLDELFEEDGAWFFTMELVDGTDWLTYVRPTDGSARLYDDARLRGSLIQIVEALSALHVTGTVHRDVKPSNVLVSRSGLVKLLDFGIATRTRRMTDEGIVGTLAYMPPEQLLSEEPTPAGDFYAVGVMLHQALTGKLPFFDHPKSATTAKLERAATPIASIAPEVPTELATLCDTLLRMNPHDRPDAAAILRVLGAVTTASSGELAASSEAFVGREAELAELADAFEAAAHGKTVTVVVEGASGVGKSALVRHFLDSVRERAVIFHGRCHEREYVPYKGVDAIVDELAAHLSEDADDVLFGLSKPAMRLLPRLFPVLERIPFFAGLGEGSFAIAEGDGYELRNQIFSAFRELIMRVAERRPLILVIDDVQWADGDTLALLGDVLAPPSPPPLLLLCTRRLGEDESQRASSPPPVALPGDVRRVSIGGLSSREIADLAAQLSRATRLEGAELSAIALESGGHPLFLQELVRRHARGNESPGHVRLDDALWARVADLGERERRIVEAVAVAGVPTSLELVMGAAGVERREVAQVMATLRSAHLVKASGTSAARRLEPYHDRVREAVVLHLDAETRRGWHERLARAIDASPERDVERLALHWEGAGDAARAAVLFREAGDRASVALAFDRAVDFYQRALALAAPEAPDRAKVELALADALFNAGRGGEAGRAFLALADATDAADARGAMVLRRRAATAYLGSGYFVEGVEVLRTVLEAVGLTFPQGKFAVISRVMWNRMRLGLSGLKFEPNPSKAADAEDLLRIDVCAAAAYGIGMADSIKGAVFHDLGARLALKAGDPLRATRGLCGHALSMCTGGVKTAERTAEALRMARTVGKDLHDPYTDALIEGVDGFAAYMIEEWPRARTQLLEAETRFREVGGSTYELATIRMMLSRTLAHLGRLRDLEVYVGSQLRDAIRRNDVYSVVNTRAIVSVLLALAHDDVPHAREEADMATATIASRPFQMQHMYCMLASCTADLYAGDPVATLARIEATRPALRKSLLERIQSVRILLTHLEARAHLALAARDPARRVAETDRAAAQARALNDEGLPGASALACLVNASVLNLRGDRAACVAMLRDALERLDTVGMSLHAATVGMYLARLVVGAEARELEANGRARFEEQGIVNRERFMAFYAPGLDA